MIPLDVVVNHLYPYLDCNSFVAWNSTCKEYAMIWKSDYFYEILKDEYGELDVKGRKMMKADVVLFSKDLLNIVKRMEEQIGWCNIEIRELKKTREKSSLDWVLKNHTVMVIINIETDCPNAESLVDHFHFIQGVSDSCSKTRKCTCYDCVLQKMRAVTGE